jgi:Cupin domain
MRRQALSEGIARTDLQQRDLSVEGRELVQARVDIGSGVTAPRHSHPGEEIVYVIEGTLEYEIEGEPPVTLKAGESVHPRRGGPLGQERRRQQRWGARHVRRREREATSRHGSLKPMDTQQIDAGVLSVGYRVASRVEAEAPTRSGARDDECPARTVGRQSA